MESSKWLEGLEGSGPDDLPVSLAFLAPRAVPFDEDELHGARRRALLLLAAGGDPLRRLELDGRAVRALASDVDRPERRAALAAALAELRAHAGGAPRVAAALERLLADGELAWRCLAAALLAEELASDEADASPSNA